jgi:hypothetical protein
MTIRSEGLLSQIDPTHRDATERCEWRGTAAVPARSYSNDSERPTSAIVVIAFSVS